jgi:hypothetical protein
MSDDSSSIANDDSALSSDLQPDFQSGVTNAIGLIAGIATVGAVASALSDVFNVLSAPKDFIVPDLAANGSPSIGSSNASAGMYGSSSMVNSVSSSLDDDLIKNDIFPGTWEALDFVINKTLNMNWKTLNSDPGNPNILEAYRHAGRGFTQDGNTGQFGWSAAFISWVLIKSGFHGLLTMSPLSYGRYGNTVSFHAGPLTNVRKWDIFVFTSNVNISHVGFVKSYNPATRTLEIVGGNQAETVKVTNMPYSVGNPLFRTIHVRRNWKIPDDIKTSIFPRVIPVDQQELPQGPGYPLTVQPLPPIGASPAEIAAFEKKYPPVPTSSIASQFGKYTTSNRRPTIDEIAELTNDAIKKSSGPQKTR